MKHKTSNRKKKRGALNPNRNITRIDQKIGDKHVTGWAVRIYRRGERFSQFFSDSTHGGKKKALEKARRTRDQKESTLKPWTRRELAERLTARNTSGHRGVRLRKTILKRDDKQYVYEHVEASWTPEPGKVAKKTFSVAKLGLDKAWKQAIEARRKGIASIEN